MKGGLNISEQQALAKKEDEGTRVHIHGVDDKPLYYEDKGEEKPVIITVAGVNSDKFREIENRQRKRKIKPRDLTGSKLHEDGIEKVAFCTLGWEGILDDNGKEVRCDFHNAKMIYSAVPHVYQQLMEAMGDAERFSGSKSTS